MSQDVRDVIAMLNEAIELEMQAFVQFHTQSLKLTGLANLPLRELLAKEADAEIGHAKKLAERVVALGGEPRMVVGPVETGTTAHEMLRLNIAREEKAIALYRRLVSKTRGAEGLELVYYLGLEILGDELHDREEFEALL